MIYINNIQKAREEKGLSRRDLSNWLNIPYRTLENWETNKRECPDYVAKLIIEKIEKDGGKNMKTIYEIKKFTAQIPYKERTNIQDGICIKTDEEPESIKKYTSMEDAKKEIKNEKYLPYCKLENGFATNFFQVEEYAIEIYQVDEDDDFVCGSDYDYFYNYKFNTEKNDIEII